MKNLDKPKNEREEFVRLLWKHDCYPEPWLEELWHWHIESQQRLLQRVRDEVIGGNIGIEARVGEEDVAFAIAAVNEEKQSQRSKLQTLQKELEEKNENTRPFPFRKQ